MTDQEKHLNEVLEGRFIKRTLQEAAHDIDVAQVRYMGSHSFDNPNWISGRTFAASETALDYFQMKKVRFVDMRQISKKMGKYKKKSHPIHNKIVWAHYNNIIRELKFGFTDSVKEQLKQLEE